MESVDGGTRQPGRPGDQDVPGRPGHSGEGARSVMEHLIQQQHRREAQLPRDADEAGESPAPAP
jgi:hypothetical protein